MKRSAFYYLLPLFFISLVIIGCKDDDDEEKPYLTGTLEYVFPSYCVIGETVESSVSGITEPEGVEYGWYSSYDDVLGNDTIPGQKVIVNIPMEKGTYSITAMASYEGYYSSVKSTTFLALDTTLSSSSSLQGIIWGTDFIDDSRDGSRYYYKQIGSLDWFINNLRYAGTSAKPVGSPYAKAKAVAPLLGNLYNWNDATGGVSGEGLGGGPQGACPEGWSVPTKEDWEDFGKVLNDQVAIPYDNLWTGLGSKAVVDATFNDVTMWSFSVYNDKSNTVGWNALPCGNSTDSYSRYQNILSYGMWWSSTEANRMQASYRYIYYNGSYFAANNVEKTDYGVSVRCVRLAK